MGDIYTITQPENDTFFLSDCHFHHNKDFVYKPRGYKSEVEATEGIISKWNTTVDDTSIVFHLGDFVFGDPDGRKILNLFRRLKFHTLFLLPGNHTSGWRQTYRDSKLKLYPYIPAEVDIYPLVTNFEGRRVVYVPNYLELRVNKNQHLILSHYPIGSWNCQNKGAIHLSGHCHSNYPISNKNTGNGKQLDVGVESFGRPVSLTEVKNHLKNRPHGLVDHHAKKEGFVSEFANGPEDSPYKDHTNDKKIL
jgi:calcineurin-like phosphoesterase family protein